LIHGQVVVGWGKPLKIGFIVLVDDEVATSDWEQELYRMGVPPHVEVIFATVEQAGVAHARYVADPRVGVLLTGDATSMLRFVEQVPAVRTVNVGGIHHRSDRTQKLRYVYLTSAEENTLRAIAAHGVNVTAQDVPSARPVSLNDIIRGDAS
jgi:PTS system mannose-specific IIB component/fructoselysine and glucoselysine-specific PTS system IIB component